MTASARGIIPYGGTFLTFRTTPENALRMARLNENPRNLRLHPRLDRLAGRPTHQSVEHAAALRLIPGMDVLADRAIPSKRRWPGWPPSSEKKPTSLLFTRRTCRSKNATLIRSRRIRRGG